LRTLILIPCCGTKEPGGTVDYDSSNSIVNYLNRDIAARLMQLRRQVAIAFGEILGPDLGFEAVQPRVKYMEAYKRYSGNLYSRIFSLLLSRVGSGSDYHRGSDVNALIQSVR
jgi:hypothetical protein